MRIILQVLPEIAYTFRESNFLRQGVATNAFVIFRGPIHFHFNERWALKLSAIEEQLFRITGEFSIASEIRITRQQQEGGALFFGQTADLLSRPPHQSRLH
jgi:hypothetical protein